MTVDNGDAGHEAIDLAQSMGVDVIEPDLLHARGFARCLCNRPLSTSRNYHFKHLAGCGVAPNCALLGEEVQVELLDLVAADMVSLTDEKIVSWFHMV